MRCNLLPSMRFITILVFPLLDPPHTSNLNGASGLNLLPFIRSEDFLDVMSMAYTNIGMPFSFILIELIIIGPRTSSIEVILVFFQQKPLKFEKQKTVFVNYLGNQWTNLNKLFFKM